MRLSTLLTITVATVLVTSTATARTWCIKEDGTGDAPTIQAGIDSAGTGDTVLVAQGTYYENISFLGKEILVGSEYVLTGDPSCIDSTIIEPGGLVNEPIVTFANGEGPGSMICGFTIQNGLADEGGGIYCYDTHPTICNNVVADNIGFTYGGGIFALHGGPTIRQNTIRGNWASDVWGDGGGIYAQYSHPVIRENEIFLNYAFYRGAGIFCEHCDPIIEDNVIHNNELDLDWGYYGGGIASRNCSPVITGNVIYDNHSGGYGGGLFY